MDAIVLLGPNGQVVCERCEIAGDFLRRGRGLLGRKELLRGQGMLIRPTWSVHTWFMRFAIDVVFLDADLTVLKIAQRLRPWRAAARRRAHQALELAAGECERLGLEVGDRLAWGRSSPDFDPDVPRQANSWRMTGARTLGGDLEEALEDVEVPSYVIDPSGVVRWLNKAAIAWVGDIRGRQFTSVVAPDSMRRSKEMFAQKVVGNAPTTSADLVAHGRNGERIHIEVTSVPLTRGGHVIGVFGLVPNVVVERDPAPHPALTPRQTEVLRYLEAGRSTRQIAADLHLSSETVRNHVRGVLRALGVNSRLEAVALARREHLLAN
jgi:PAS domain S-box-containing protein